MIHVRRERSDPIRRTGIGNKLRRIVFGKIIVPSNQEPAILVHRDKACDFVIVAIIGLVILNKVSFVRHSQSNRLALKALRQIGRSYIRFDFVWRRCLVSKLYVIFCLFG